MGLETAAMVLLAGLAAVVVFAPEWWQALLGLSLFGAVLSLRYLQLHAPDVAMTEVALGAGLTTVVFLVAFRHCGENTE